MEDDKVTEVQKSAAGRYMQLERLREPFLRRARDCAKVTLPYLIPPNGHKSTSDLYTPYQSLGSRGVNNLAAKLLVTQLPPNTPFFRYTVTDKAAKELEQQGIDAKQGKIDAALARYERIIQKKIEAGGFRPVVFEMEKHLIIAGNALVFLPKKGPARLFSLDQYVVKRDASGNVLEIITKESVAPMALPENVRKLLPHKDAGNVEDDVELYTWVKREDGRWSSHQELCDGIVVEDTKGTYPLDNPAYLALRWHSIAGEDYGRGYVEDYLGDLMSLEGLSQAIVEGSAAAARVLIMVKPGAATTHRQITKANSGDVLSGDINDVGVLQLEKYADFRVAREVIEEISKRLGFAFLLNTSIQRPGERVTAEEVRYMAQELETALGGTYSVMSQEFQLPFLKRIEYTLHASGELPKLPKEFAEPAIITGIEALGRGQDLQKLRGFVEMVSGMGPLAQQILARLNVGEFLERAAAAGGIDTEGLIKTDEEVAAEEQKQQQMQAMMQMAPQAVGAIGGMAKQVLANNGAQGGPAPEGAPPAPPEG